MRKLNYIVLGLIIGMLTMAFQCSSTELTSAKLYIQQKNFDKALESLQREVQKNPQSDEGWYLMGVVQGEKGNMEEMMESFNKSLAVSNKYADDINKAKQYHWVNVFNQGAAYFTKGKNSTDLDSTLLHLNNSAASFEKAIKLEPDSQITYTNLAFVHQQIGNLYFEEGVKLRSKYTESSDPQDSIAYIAMFDKAIDSYKTGRKVYPDDPEFIRLLVNSYIITGREEIAFDLIREGIEKDPTNKTYRFNYGVLLFEAKDYAQAETQFLEAIKLDSAYYDAIYNLARLYLQWDIVSRENEDPEINSIDFKKKYETVLPWLEKAVEENDKDAAMWELLGSVYTVLNMPGDADNAFKKADALRQ